MISKLPLVKGALRASGLQRLKARSSPIKGQRLSEGIMIGRGLQ
jgi:hypothetical protein